MIAISFIRHGTTQPNTIGYWAGSTDVPITAQAKEELSKMARYYPYPRAEVIYRSPLIRCKQTMEEIYPYRNAIVIDDLRELDFGDYEGAYGPDALEELGAQPILDRQLDFQFPGGESFEICLNRGIRAVDQIVCESIKYGKAEISVVTHSMWISIMLRYCLNPMISAEEMFCGNGMGIKILLEPNEWFKKRKFHFDCHVPVGAPIPRYEDSPYWKRK